MKIDDKGNEVFFWTKGEVAILDREADPIDGIDMEFGYAWSGAGRDTRFACENGYDLDIAIAIMCGLLRGEQRAQQQMVDFVQWELGDEKNKN